MSLLRRLGLWLARDDIAQLERLCELLADDKIAGRLTCPERLLCIRQAVALERLTTRPRT